MSHRITLSIPENFTVEIGEDGEPVFSCVDETPTPDIQYSKIPMRSMTPEEVARLPQKIVDKAIELATLRGNIDVVTAHPEVGGVHNSPTIRFSHGDTVVGTIFQGQYSVVNLDGPYIVPAADARGVNLDGPYIVPAHDQRLADWRGILTTDFANNVFQPYSNSTAQPLNNAWTTVGIDSSGPGNWDPVSQPAGWQLESLKL
jgi:hypothetical protein